VHDPAKLVQETLVPLKEIGKLWKKLGPHHAAYAAQAPTIASNLANNQAANSSWSNDDDDHTS
jgi:hypothetical protein